ncbi:UDP-N-acetylmuramate dehydrogenase [Dongshaea marina]|uniref:UDP-N-acetylmuramate dehydrogenase n=1 Tax=Dongshaea marina TaxID=2047966 RepID=UPI000D3EDDE6|nr:UDP-N-acetylmuramate dehydrogenase [Dongshaea marina]
MDRSSHSLKSLHTFGLEQSAFQIITIDSLSALREACNNSKAPVVVVGGGSNILPVEDFSGTVLLNRISGRELKERDDHYLLEAGAGENWLELVQWSLEQGAPGLENLALIPGSSGAAPVQNIGAYGIEFATFCEYVEAYNRLSGELERFAVGECEFGYRTSIFKTRLRNSHIITRIGLKLPKTWQANLEYGPLQSLSQDATPQDVFERVCRLREQKLPDPSELGNAGSFFKNPLVSQQLADELKAHYPKMPCYPVAGDMCKLAAGWLIDQAGLKGFELGRAGVHQEQALVLVNLGGATARELVSLACLVRARVNEMFGVTLEPEVQLLGAQGFVTLDEVVQ